VEARRVIVEELHRVAPDADVEALDPDDDLVAQLGVDSLDFLSIVTGVEQRTGIEIPERDFPRLLTLAAFADYVSARAA